MLTYLLVFQVSMVRVQPLFLKQYTRYILYNGQMLKIQFPDLKFEHEYQHIGKRPIFTHWDIKYGDLILLIKNILKKDWFQHWFFLMQVICISQAGFVIIVLSLLFQIAESTRYPQHQSCHKDKPWWPPFSGWLPWKFQIGNTIWVDEEGRSIVIKCGFVLYLLWASML